MEREGLVLCKRCKIFKSSNNIGFTKKSSSYMGQRVNYKGTPTSSIGGMDFDKDETKEEIEAKHETNLERVRQEVGDKGISIIKDFVEGPICLQIPNLERAIKICCGNKIWCLDGILKSMKEKPSCPLGREEITTEFFSKVEMSNFIVEALQSESGKVSSLKGTDHKKDLTGFCNTCDGFLGIRGIIKQHNGHDIIETEEKYPIVTKKIQEEARNLKRNLDKTDDLQSGIFDKGEKNKEMLMSGVEPLLSLITEQFKKYHQKSWGWFEHYMSKLDKIKEYQSTKTKHNKDLISQGLMSNITELYSVQKELQRLNKALLEYQQNYKVLSKNSPFSAEKYSFEFKFDKTVGNTIIDAISKKLS